jgi:uncharacterized protein (TIGR00730 family)
VARYRHKSEPQQVEKAFPSAGEDRLRTNLDPDTAQTRSPAYRLGFADNELLLRDDLRPVRLQLEFLKPDLLQEDRGVELTVAIFGSARIPAPEVAQARFAQAEELARLNPDDAPLAEQYRVAKSMVGKAKYYDEARRLSRLISATQLPREEMGGPDAPGRSDPPAAAGDGALALGGALAGDAPTAGDIHSVFVVTGGGPGIMEAANRGAQDIGAESIAHNIVLPFEQMPNPYITPELCFNFHYFALRKMHFLMRSVALVVFPGGYGTLDELFEVLTLIQTHKIRPIPVLLFGREYWERIVDFGALVEEGVITRADLGIFSYVETADEAWCLLEPVLKKALPTCERPPHRS